MAFPKGNRFWEQRSSHGRKPIFETPEAMWNAACEYFKWVDDNPLWESKVTQYQGEPITMTVPKIRAMTQSGLCLFLDITQETYIQYRSKDGFSEVTNNIDAVIRDQKFSGAAADLLNANIIARDLGLKDSTETTHKGSIDLTKLSEEDLDRKLELLRNEQRTEN